jgi:hypothetical protein
MPKEVVLLERTLALGCWVGWFCLAVQLAMIVLHDL